MCNDDCLAMSERTTEKISDFQGGIEPTAHGQHRLDFLTSEPQELLVNMHVRVCLWQPVA